MFKINICLFFKSFIFLLLLLLFKFDYAFMSKGKYFIESVKEGCDIIYLFMAVSDHELSFNS